MARLLLSDAHDWHLSFPDEQDVRGFRALDAERNDTGRTVDDMVIDTDAEHVSHVVLSDGTEFPARDLSIGDGVVYLAGTDLTAGDDSSTVRPGVTVFEDGHVVRRETIGGADSSDSDERDL